MPKFKFPLLNTMVNPNNPLENNNIGYRHNVENWSLCKIHKDCFS